MGKFSTLLFLLLAASLTACSKNGDDAGHPPAKPATGPTDAEIPVELNSGVLVVHAEADDAMHFNGNRFSVKTGQPVRIELLNKGSRPATEMMHNFVILKPGVDELMFNLACAPAKADGYLPTSQMDNVLFHTPLAGPGQMVTVDFTAPAPGQYPFVCNFPGHYAAGMHGIMTVTP